MNSKIHDVFSFFHIISDMDNMWVKWNIVRSFMRQKGYNSMSELQWFYKKFNYCNKLFEAFKRNQNINTDTWILPVLFGWAGADESEEGPPSISSKSLELEVGAGAAGAELDMSPNMSIMLEPCKIRRLTYIGWSKKMAKLLISHKFQSGLHSSVELHTRPLQHV